MPRPRRRWAIAIAAFALVPAAWCADDSPAAVVEAFQAALHNGDAAQALALMTPDAFVYEMGNVNRDRDDYARTHLPADINLARAVETRTIGQQVLGNGELAIVTVEYDVTGVFRSAFVDQLSIGTVLLVRTPEGWRIWHIHLSSHQR